MRRNCEPWQSIVAQIDHILTPFEPEVVCRRQFQEEQQPLQHMVVYSSGAFFPIKLNSMNWQRLRSIDHGWARVSIVFPVRLHFVLFVTAVSFIFSNLIIQQPSLLVKWKFTIFSFFQDMSAPFAQERWCDEAATGRDCRCLWSNYGRK